MSALNYSGVVTAIVTTVNLVIGCKQRSRRNRQAKAPKIDALIFALRPLYSRLSHINEMCIELMDGNDPILRTKICGLIDDVNYNEGILSCLSAIDNLSLDMLNYSSETIKSLGPLRVWLADVTSGFTFNPSELNESKMHDEIKNFGKIVDGAVEAFAKELYGFWAWKRGKSVLYKKLDVVDAT